MIAGTQGDVATFQMMQETTAVDRNRLEVEIAQFHAFEQIRERGDDPVAYGMPTKEQLTGSLKSAAGIYLKSADATNNVSSAIENAVTSVAKKFFATNPGSGE